MGLHCPAQMLHGVCHGCLQRTLTPDKTVKCRRARWNCPIADDLTKAAQQASIFNMVLRGNACAETAISVAKSFNL